MKIFIEGSALFKDRSGVGQYAKKLVEAMAHSYPNNQYSVFGFKFWGRPLPEPIFEKDLKISYRFIRFMPGRGYNLLRKMHLALPIDILLRQKPDVLFFPNFVKWPVFFRKSKSIVAVYDLSFIYFSQYTQPKNLAYMLKFVEPSVKKASHIITISQNSKREIVKHYKIDPKKVSIVQPAIDPADFFPRPTQDIEAVRKKYKLPKKYILHIGTLEPRKNIEGILQAYAGLSEDLQKQYSLVLAGGKGWNDGHILQTIESLRSQGKAIVCTGYVPDQDLAAVYSGAAAFVYPTFYEGFGMPPLEAMACGVPVITSNNSSLPEVMGPAGIMLDASDTVGLTKAVTKVLNDKAFANKLRRAGLAQAKLFRWDKSAQDMIKVIESLK